MTVAFFHGPVSVSDCRADKKEPEYAGAENTTCDNNSMFLEVNEVFLVNEEKWPHSWGQIQRGKW
jgi:hypothetical protein